MNEAYDPLERELAALRPAEPSANLADRMEARLSAEPITATKAQGTRFAPAAVWIAIGSALAAGLLIAVSIWRGNERTNEAERSLELPQPTLATALDDSLPSVWTYRSAVNATASLDDLLDEHAAPPAATGQPEQTRGFVPVTMNMNSRFGEL